MTGAEDGAREDDRMSGDGPGEEIGVVERDFPVSYAIFAMARAHRAIAASRLATLGLYPGQELVLVQLGEGDGVPQKALARALRVSHVTIAKMITRMERAGLVERRASPTDRRLSLVHLLDPGRTLLQEVRRTWAALEEATTRDLDATSRTAFLEAAALVRPALDDAAGEATQPG